MRRIKRIFPVLLLVLTCCLVVGWLVLLPNEFMELSKHVAGGVAYIANITQWMDSGYFDAAAETKPLMHLWSLGIEEQFYLIWPVVLFICWRRRINLSFVIGTAIVLSFVVNIGLIKRMPDAVFYLPVFRFWELLIGAALAWWTLQKTTSLSRLVTEALSCSGLIMIVGTTWLLNKYSTFPGWWALLPTIGASFVIAAGPQAFLNRYVLSAQPIVWIGLISYPLYLWHWPLISFLHIAGSDVPWILNKFIVVAGSFLLAWLSYRLLEKPIRDRVPLRAATLYLVIASLVIGSAGLFAYLNRGIPSRFGQSEQGVPLVIQKMLDPSYGVDLSVVWREHRCFLAKGEGPNQFASECVEGNDRPLVFLWGDSHAAALYQGLKELQETRPFSIAQYTASLCPPTLAWDNPQNKFCREINDSNLERIKVLKPDVVLLQAQWVTGGYYVPAVFNAVDALKTIGIRKIIVLGSSPLWDEVASKNVIKYFKKFERMPPKYTDFGLWMYEETLQSDAYLKQESQKRGVEFISIYETLCHTDGCQLMVGKEAEDISTFDQGHLSPAASSYVIHNIAPRIFGD